MVFNVSSSVQPKVDVGKTVNDCETDQDKSLLVAAKPAKKRGACCLVVPWLLFFICLIMLAAVGSWGWNEHKKLQDYLRCKNKIPSHFVMTPSEPLSPLLMNDTPIKIPYGDDALDPALENDIANDDDEDDVISHEESESVDDEMSDTPVPTPSFPFHFFHIKFPFNLPTGSEDGDRVRSFRYRLIFNTHRDPETEASGED